MSCENFAVKVKRLQSCINSLFKFKGVSFFFFGGGGGEESHPNQPNYVSVF